MKAWAYLKLHLKAIVKQIHVIFFTGVMFPLIMGLVMANFQKEAFVKENKAPFIEVVINDEDKSQMSESLISFLKGDELKNIIVIKEKDSEKAINLIIKSGYEEKLKSNENQEIIIKEGKSTEGVSLKILNDVLEKYYDGIYEWTLIEKNISNKNLSEEKKSKLYKNVSEEIFDINNSSFISESVLKSKRSLTAYEYFSVTMLSYLIFILIAGIVHGGYQEKEIGVTDRIKAAPITAIENFNYGFLGTVIYSICLMAMYIGLYKILGLSFKGSMTLLTLLVVISAIFTVSVSCLLAQIIGKKYFTAFITVIMFIQIILGGTFVPLKQFTSNEFIRGLAKFSPDALITKAYNGYIIHNNFNSISVYLLGLLVVSLVAYLLCLVIIKVKEEVLLR